MGMYGIYRRLSPQVFKYIRDDPYAADAYFGFNIEDLEKFRVYFEKLENDERYLDIGKAWYYLHYLLTGSTIENPINEPPWGNVILGGAESDWDGGLGPVRYLTPEEVKEVAQAMNDLSLEDLRARFNGDDFLRVSRYPERIWNDEEKNWVIENFVLVRDFFSKGAENGEVILLSIE